MNIKTKKVKIELIRINPDNPRTITDKALDNLTKSLAEFPEMMSLREIVVHESMMIIGGNMRYQALKKSGAPQAEIFREYKIALLRATAMDRAIRTEERIAQREKRYINPDNITDLANEYLARMPYKAQGCRYHSFVVYFSNIVRLGWVEATGREEPSAFQEHYPNGQPRRYYRLTQAGLLAGDEAWSNPLLTLYGSGRSK